MSVCASATWRIIHLLVVFIGLLAASEASIDMHVDQAEPAVGDRITVTVHYRWPSDWHLDQEPHPAAVFDAEGCFLINVPPPQELDDGIESQRIWQLTMLAGSSGAWSLPRPGLQLTDPAGEIHTISAPEVIIQVGAGDDSAQLPEPSKPWLRADGGAPRGSSWPWLIVGLIAITLTAWLLLRRREPEHQLTPAERFAQDLRLVHSTVDGKHAGSLLSQALRRYAGGIFGFDGVGATVRECRALIREHLDGDVRQEFLRILEELDALRWSAAELDPERIGPLVTASDQWVKQMETARAKETDQAA
jgi:hypothetical protein